ncbi:MAG: GNAT family N-acetyltransferase [Pseudomonadota bacterium]
MMDVIKTERLVLRRFRDADIPAITAALQDRDIVRMMPQMPWPYTRADAEQYVREVAPSKPLGFAIEHNGTLIGSVGADIRLGYWLSRLAWCQGFASEAARGLLGYRFERDRSTLLSGHRVDNPGSRRVLKKLGFVDVSQKSVHSFGEGADVKIQVMQLTHAAWEAQQ